MQTSGGFLTTQDGVRLYFEQLGSGAPVIVPNGLYFRDDFRHLTGRTLIFYDVRNRGRSETVTDIAKLARGIQQDVDDLESVRRHFRFDQVDVIGHSYIGLVAALYAMKYRANTARVVQIGPVQPDATRQYPPDLSHADSTSAAVMSEMARMLKDRPSGDPEDLCRQFWSILRPMYVVNPADAARINWGRCELENERNFMRYWTAHLWPSIQGINLTQEDFAKATSPVLIVHGTKDRNAPYGGGRDWAMRLPDARLVTVENAAHAPWIEAPELVFNSIETFLDGEWPKSAEKVTSL